MMCLRRQPSTGRDQDRVLEIRYRVVVNFVLLQKGVYLHPRLEAKETPKLRGSKGTRPVCLERQPFGSRAGQILPFFRLSQSQGRADRFAFPGSLYIFGSNSALADHRWGQPFGAAAALSGGVGQAILLPCSALHRDDHDSPCFAGCPTAVRKIALLPLAWGPKKRTTSSS